ncbi:MAG TPA: DNA primase, partial [Syntrophobacteria bacterium]|nr:DNA primase [Syntrophobacteria bacterium]
TSVGRLTREAIEEIRTSVNIVDVVSAHVPLRKRGKTYVGLCPFHGEKTPSFTVSDDRQAFYCFGCGVGGSVFDFLMRVRNLTFVEAARELADRYGIRLPEASETKDQRRARELVDFLCGANETAAAYFHQVLLEDPAAASARDYLRSRGMGPEITREFRLGYAPSGWDGCKRHLLRHKISPQAAVQAGLLVQSGQGEPYDRFRNRIMFPIRDLAGRVVGFGGRALDDTPPKYLNSPESPVFHKGRILYGLPVAKEACRKEGETLVVEGYFDLLALQSNGIRNVVAPLGTALTPQHVRLLARLAPRAVVVFDGDEAGMRAALRSLEIFLREKLPARLLKLPGGMDPDDFVRQQGKEAFFRLLGEARPLLEVFLDETLADFDGSIATKVRSVRTVGPLLKLLDVGVEQESYLQFLTRRLNVSEEALRQELRLGGTPEAERGRAPAEAPGGGRVPAMEEVVLRILVHYPKHIPLVMEAGVIEDFEGREWQRLGRLVEKHGGEGGILDVGGLLVDLDNAELRRQVSSWSVEEKPWSEEDASLRLREYLGGIKGRKRRRLDELRRLQEEIRVAEEKRDDVLLRELLAKKVALAARSTHGKANLTKGEMD